MLIPLLQAAFGQKQTDANPMSNESLINRIEVVLELVQTEQAPARALAESIRGDGRALEGMPYCLIKELENMAMDLDIAQWHDEDGFAPALAPVLIRVREWLSKLPRNI